MVTPRKRYVKRPRQIKLLERDDYKKVGRKLGKEIPVVRSIRLAPARPRSAVIG